ncbi:MAG: T9SS type A sorting domain-containing protein [Ferruginibacter sp.]
MDYIKKSVLPVSRIFLMLVSFMVLSFYVTGNNGKKQDIFNSKSILLTGYKSTTARQGSIRAKTTVTDLQSFRANLYIASPGGDIMADGILVDYEAMYSNAVDYDDAPKMYNGNENVGLRRDGSMLSIERRNTMGNRDTLYLNISGLRVQAYRWVISGIDIAAPGRVAYLSDNFLNTTTPMNLGGSTIINFNVTGLAASYANNRFTIIFEQAAVVPVSVTNISANRNNNKSVSVNWHVENEIAIEKYEVERSNDGRNFQMINIAMPSVAAYGNYQFTDLNPIATNNFYRIKATSQSGLVQFSAVVKVKALETSSQLAVYPTLISDKKINIFFNDIKSSIYAVQVTTSAGKVIYQNRIAVNSMNQVNSIDLVSAHAGVYAVTISNERGFKNSYKIVIE